MVKMRLRKRISRIIKFDIKSRFQVRSVAKGNKRGPDSHVVVGLLASLIVACAFMIVFRLERIYSSSAGEHREARLMDLITNSRYVISNLEHEVVNETFLSQSLSHRGGFYSSMSNSEQLVFPTFQVLRQSDHYHSAVQVLSDGSYCEVKRNSDVEFKVSLSRIDGSSRICGSTNIAVSSFTSDDITSIGDVATCTSRSAEFPVDKYNDIAGLDVSLGGLRRGPWPDSRALDEDGNPGVFLTYIGRSIVGGSNYTLLVRISDSVVPSLLCGNDSQLCDEGQVFVVGEDGSVVSSGSINKTHMFVNSEVVPVGARFKYSKIKDVPTVDGARCLAIGDRCRRASIWQFNELTAGITLEGIADAGSCSSAPSVNSNAEPFCEQREVPGEWLYAHFDIFYEHPDHPSVAIVPLRCATGICSYPEDYRFSQGQNTRYYLVGVSGGEIFAPVNEFWLRVCMAAVLGECLLACLVFGGVPRFSTQDILALKEYNKKVSREVALDDDATESQASDDGFDSLH